MAVCANAEAAPANSASACACAAAAAATLAWAAEVVGPFAFGGSALPAGAVVTAGGGTLT